MMSYHTTGHKKKGSPLTVIKIISEHECNGRRYKFLKVLAGGFPYLCLRLYNAKGRFIKQFLFEASVAHWLEASLLYYHETGGGSDGTD